MAIDPRLAGQAGQIRKTLQSRPTVQQSAGMSRRGFGVDMNLDFGEKPRTRMDAILDTIDKHADTKSE